VRENIAAIWHGYLSKRPAGLTEWLSYIAQNLRDDVPEGVNLGAKFGVGEHRFPRVSKDVTNGP
jgi:hypothetical protein